MYNANQNEKKSAKELCDDDNNTNLCFDSFFSGKI